MAQFRTTMALARGLGAAGTGTRDFWHQRVTSVLGVLLATGVIVVIAGSVGTGYEGVARRLSDPLVVLLLLAALLNFCVHMRIGMQVIIEDYVHTPVTKALLLIANTGFTAAIGLAGAAAVLKIAFSG